LRKLKVFLVLSLLINILIIGTLSFVISKQGGTAFLEKHIKGLVSPQKHPDYYLQKKNIFETLDHVEHVDKVFVGDSISDHGEFQEYFPKEVVLNRGIGEDETAGVLNRIDEVVNRNPKKVYILIGINDIQSKVEKDVYQKNMEKIVDSFDKNSTTVVLQSILPINNKDFHNTISNEKVHQFNVVLQKIAEEKGIQYIDLHRHFEDENGQLKKELTVDGIHLNGKGYDIWMNNLK
jgi:lysophospholipase L1-like esterase